jgi:hypothetical protein
MLLIRRLTLVLVAVFSLAVEPAGRQAADPLPARLSDAAFWKLISDFSEPDGTFLISDNFVSNERGFQHVLPSLATEQQPASTYIGVGPEQNFTYILALKPQIAFIVDIRRQNLVEHLMYKALFELSADRAEFLSRLFSRPRPEGLTHDTSVDAMIAAFSPIGADVEVFQDNLRAIKHRLIVGHGFELTLEDEAAIEKILRAFGRGGNLTYSGAGASSSSIMPTFGDLMRETDRDGVQRSFLATEKSFLYLKEFQGKNLVVPVVGDFAGPVAVRSIGQYVKDHSATVTAFYTSNVEQYLFFDKAVADRFYANVATLPLSMRSVFIRGLIRSPNGDYSPSPLFTPVSRFEVGLFSIRDLVGRFAAGEVQNYNDILMEVTAK